MPTGVDARTGRRDAGLPTARSPPRSSPGRELHAVDEGPSGGAATDLGAFTVTGVGSNELTMEPAEAEDRRKQLERLALAAGPWSLHEADPSRWPSHHADNLAAKEWVAAETFLVIDPLVSLSTALAARSWVWSLGVRGGASWPSASSSRAASAATSAPSAR